jgi:hypothetical protein
MRHSNLFFTVKLNFDDTIKRKTNKNQSMKTTQQKSSDVLFTKSGDLGT